MSTVAILIPCYNAAELIEATLQSAVDDMDEGDELVLVDDHSEDESLSIVTQFLNQSGVNFIAAKNPSKGDCAASNHALSISKNPWIQWPDVDNIPAKDKLKEQLLELNRSPNSLAASPFVPFLGDPINGVVSENRDWTCARFVSGADWPASCRMNIPACWLGPRQLIEQAGPWDEQLKMNQDGHYFARVPAQARSSFSNPRSTSGIGVESAIRFRGSQPKKLSLSLPAKILSSKPHWPLKIHTACGK